MFTLAKVSMLTLVTMTLSDTLVLVLATLGGTSEMGSFLFYVALPTVAKASIAVTVVCHCH